MVMVLFYLTNIYNIRVRQKNYWYGYNDILKSCVRKYEIKLSEITPSYKIKKCIHMRRILVCYAPYSYLSGMDKL